jgi:hypothetical protein
MLGFLKNSARCFQKSNATFKNKVMLDVVKKSNARYFQKINATLKKK